ncbi:MAG: PH domain-containing protein [Clostridia bacterium]|nr:PH domain-containing protein [Clostridia bacterium]
MKFRMNFGIVKTVIIAIVLAGALALAGLDIAMLAGAEGLTTSLPAVAGVSLAAAVIITVAAILVLFNSQYKFDKDNLVVVLGVFKDKIPYSSITAVKEDSRLKEFYIFAKGARVQDGDVSLRLAVSPKAEERVVSAIRVAMPSMIIEVFESEDKRKKK